MISVGWGGVSASAARPVRRRSLAVRLRRLQPWHSNAGKRLVKSPKMYVRDSGLVHALLGIDSHDALLSHPVVGNSWEGFVVETLLNAAPLNTSSGFYRTSNGAEIDLLLNLPGHGLWAIEIKRGATGKPRRGFYSACDDLKPDRRFLVQGGHGSYPLGEGIEALGLRELAGLLNPPSPRWPSPPSHTWPTRLS